jgi:hypothetical protein
MLNVTPAELAQWLDRYQGGCRIVSATMLTPLKMNKTHRDNRAVKNPFLVDGESTIDHLSERVVFCGASYENMVSNQIAKNVTPVDGFVPVFQAEALWKGKGLHLNRYIVKHTEKQTLYLCLFFASVKSEEDKWVEKSLQHSVWLDRFTGLPIEPDWTALEPFLPPESQPSKKQGCREGCDVEVGSDGFIVRGGENTTEIRVRMPHLENVLQLRSFDLKQRGKYDIIQVKRTRHQISV